MSMEVHRDMVVESREELIIITPKTKNPTLRKAHFLLPPDSNTHVQNPMKPTLQKTTPISNPESLKVIFNGWFFPQANWRCWIDRLIVKHRETWEKAGILEPIWNSVNKLPHGEDLVIDIAKQWCPETNTFVFPFGEATVTLEDMMICCGYSVLGSPVFGSGSAQEAEEMKVKEEKLDMVRLAIIRSKAKKATHCRWMRHFYEGESDVEHEAFLTLWLSRFVFSTFPKDTVSNRFFPLAIRLARGIRVALGPAVLARVYRDLTLLRHRVESASRPDCGELNKLVLWSPMHVVIDWMLNRFSPRQLRRNHLELNEFSVEVFTQELFCWRPYVASSKSFYGVTGGWVSILGLDEESQSFIQCLRSTDLVGIDPLGFLFAEKYSPHRVARQFGYDQDLPCNVARNLASTNYVEAWTSYIKPFGCKKIYFPSKFFKPGVTLKYQEWWDGSKLDSRDVARDAKKIKEENNLEFPPGFEHVFAKKKELMREKMLPELFDGKRKRSGEDTRGESSNSREEEKNLEFPPGFEHVFAKRKELMREKMHTGVFDKRRKRSGEETRANGSNSREEEKNLEFPPGFEHAFAKRKELMQEKMHTEVFDGKRKRSGEETRGETSNSQADNNKGAHNGALDEMRKGPKEETRGESSELQAKNNNSALLPSGAPVEHCDEITRFNFIKGHFNSLTKGRGMKVTIEHVCGPDKP